MTGLVIRNAIGILTGLTGAAARAQGDIRIAAGLIRMEAWTAAREAEKAANAPPFALPQHQNLLIPQPV